MPRCWPRPRACPSSTTRGRGCSSRSASAPGRRSRNCWTPGTWTSSSLPTSRGRSTARACTWDGPASSSALLTWPGSARCCSTAASGRASRWCPRTGSVSRRPSRWTRSAGGTRRTPSGKYGYQWWVTEADEAPAYFAWGGGGQLLEVVPSLSLVVVVASEIEYGQPRSAGFSANALTFLVDHVDRPVRRSTDLHPSDVTRAPLTPAHPAGTSGVRGRRPTRPPRAATRGSTEAAGPGWPPVPRGCRSAATRARTQRPPPP